MTGLLFLLCCTQILSVVLCQNQTKTQSQDGVNKSINDSSNTLTVTSTSVSIQSSIGTSLSTSTSTSTRTKTKTSGSISATTTMTDITPSFINVKECLPVLFLTMALIICCTILLISTLMLTCHVCHLSRRIKALSSSDDDLISNSDYWTGTAKRNKGKSEKPEDKEASVLLADVSQAQDETAATREENGTASGDKKEEAGEGASATAAEESSSTKPQEETSDGQPTEAEAAPASE